MNENLSWIKRDLAVIWHPCTQMKDHEWLPLIPFSHGAGVWLFDAEGHRYLDAISSWWVNLFGHCHPLINQAIIDQLGQLEHALLAGATHEPAIRLAERLLARAPPGLTRCFYVDNGSAAVEAALKMSFHYWKNKGYPQKDHFVSLENAYHGETLGALAVGSVGLYRDAYEPLLHRSFHVSGADLFDRPQDEPVEDYTCRRFSTLERLLAREADHIAAVIIEPLVQCAGGMRMHAPLYLTLLRECCNRYGVHLIADECAVGMGRTGTFFACEQGEIIPDILITAKGLTGGYLPLAALLVRESIYQAFYADYETHLAFLHSHSYTGNPLACRAALATLELFDASPVLERNLEINQWLQKGLEPLIGHPHVSDVRITGTIAAVELASDGPNKIPYPLEDRRGIEVFRYGLEHEAWLRPLGNVVYLIPPYVITANELDTLCKTVRDAIDHVSRI
ncbi:MAG: adenosylmethionine--8-amino-7-oxononanoate transaminase [Gammaproteobacteria bacterium]